MNKSDTPEYNSWISMIHRCHNPRHPKYIDYGLRGIKVCSRWRYSFERFLADMGPRPFGAKYSIDRIDNNRGYEPDNCRWATDSEQNLNRRGWHWHQKPIPERDLEAIKNRAYALWQKGALDATEAKRLGIDRKTLHNWTKEFVTS